MIAVGIDVGGTSIKGATIRSDGTVLDRFSMPVDKTAAPEVEIGKLCDLVNECLATHKYDEKIAGIGIGIPGSVDNESGLLIRLTNLPTWNGFPLKKFMEERCHLYVKMINDADAAALGEAKLGRGKDVNYMLMFTLGTGVGGGIVINKVVYSGNKGMGAELGHITVEHNGRQCGCGRKGCLEAYASATALINETKKAMEAHPESKLHEVAKELGTVDARVPFRAEERGDEVAYKIIEEYVMWLSEGLISYCNIFRPNMIVLSGGVANEGENLLKRIRKYLKDHTDGMPGSAPVEVEQGKLGYDSGKIGAAALYF